MLDKEKWEYSREEAEINWLFPEDNEEEIEDTDFPYEEENYD